MIFCMDGRPSYCNVPTYLIVIHSYIVLHIRTFGVEIFGDDVSARVIPGIFSTTFASGWWELLLCWL